MIITGKKLAAAAMALFFAVSTASCGEIVIETAATSRPADRSEASDSGELSGSLMLTGSTSMSDVATALAEEFMALNPDVVVSVGGNGSGEGPTSVKDGTAQIGMLSRELKDSENPDLFDKYIIGYDGIVVIVNPACGVTSLTIEQVAGIFRGDIKNWKEVGGSDSVIQCIGREAASGTRGAFEELLGIEDGVRYSEEQNSTGNVKQAVSSNVNAIGYVSISAVDESVKGLILDGVSPTEENVKDGTYTLQRPFVMITKAGAADSLSAAFLDFVYSGAGMQIVADDGIVPNPGKNG